MKPTILPQKPILTTPDETSCTGMPPRHHFDAQGSLQTCGNLA